MKSTGARHFQPEQPPKTLGKAYPPLPPQERKEDICGWKAARHVHRSGSARHCCRCRGQNRKQNKEKVLPSWSIPAVRETDHRQSK